MAKVNLYIIRHGQTQYNLEHRIQGDTLEVDLNQQGHTEARATGLELARRNVLFHRVFSSPLNRTKQTLENILNASPQCNLSNEVIYDLRVRERSFGVLHHKLSADLDLLLSKWDGPLHEFAAPGGESRVDLFARAINWLDEQNELAKQVSETQNWLLVTHGGVLRSMFAYADGKDATCSAEYDSDNGAISIFELGKDLISLITQNDVKHLELAGLLAKQVKTKIA